jgi:hypothetical protein
MSRLICCDPDEFSVAKILASRIFTSFYRGNFWPKAGESRAASWGSTEFCPLLYHGTLLVVKVDFSPNPSMNGGAKIDHESAFLFQAKELAGKPVCHK